MLGCQVVHLARTQGKSCMRVRLAASPGPSHHPGREREIPLAVVSLINHRSSACIWCVCADFLYQLYMKYTPLSGWLFRSAGRRQTHALEDDSEMRQAYLYNEGRKIFATPVSGGEGAFQFAPCLSYHTPVIPGMSDNHRLAGQASCISISLLAKQEQWSIKCCWWSVLAE